MHLQCGKKNKETQRHFNKNFCGGPGGSFFKKRFLAVGDAGDNHMSLYDNIAEFYDQIFPLKETRMSFIDSFLSRNGLTILDIGCATGELALALSKKGHHVVGIDLDGKMVELARQKTKKTGLKAEFFVKDMAKIGVDFSSAYFDVVLCLGNTLVHLESLEKIEQFLSAMGKVLKKGGMVII
jgi:glycine/sarcosine N-methyltransferase